MAKSEARRQKQLAKKKSKRDDKRGSYARLNSDDPTIRLASAESWPIAYALVPAEIWERGMGTVVIARRCPDGRLATGLFLIDTWCLGVKDAHWKIQSEAEFVSETRRMERAGGDFNNVAPEHLAKLIYGAVDFALAYGFQPHPDYRYPRMLLAGIDAAQCQDVFEFGKDGKPFYFQGPHDSPARVRSIVQRLGQGKGDYVIVANGSRQIRELLDSDELPVSEEWE